jgi:succinyl-diaminopimelate desuccinylase
MDDKKVILSAAIAGQFGQQVEFLQRLVHARSANPFTPETSSPDVPVEAEVASVIDQELCSLGFKAELIGVSPGRPNVVCRLPAAGKAVKTLILTTHMDTVEPSGYSRDPWGAHIEAGRLYGVGAADAKAQITAFIYAVYALHTLGVTQAGNLTLAFVVDEEAGACSPYGTQYLLDNGLLGGDAASVVPRPPHCEPASQATPACVALQSAFCCVWSVPIPVCPL